METEMAVVDPKAIRQYVKLYGRERHYEEDKLISENTHEIHDCKMADYLYSETAEWIEKVGKNSKPLCIKQMGAISLQGSPFSVNRTDFTIHLQRCTNVTAEDIAKKRNVAVSMLTREDREQITLCKKPEEIDAFVNNLIIQTHAFYDEVRFNKYGTKPTEKVYHEVGHVLLDSNKYQVQEMYLRKNLISTNDQLFNLGTATSENYKFYDVGEIKTKDYRQSPTSGSIWSTKIQLYNNQNQYKRISYDFILLLGDLGGVFSLFITLFGFVILPISKFAFNLKAIQKLFLVRTKDKGLFDDEKVLRNKNFELSKKEELP